MAGYPQIPLAGGLARIFDWKNPDRESINLSRLNAQQYLAANPGDYEGMIRTFGPSMGMGADYGRILEKLDAENERKRQLLTQMQPTSQFQPREQSFSMTETGAPPESMADRVFPVPPPPPRPESPGETPSYARTGSGIRTFPEALAGPDERGLAPTEPDLPEPRAFLPEPKEFGVEPSGAYPRRSPIESGGTVTTPGKSLEEIVRADPSMARLATEWYPKLEQADLEQRGNRAALQFARAVNTREMTVEEAYDKHGQDLSLSPAGLKILDAYKDRLAAKKSEIQLRQDEEARTWAREKIEQLRKSDDTAHHDLADALEFGLQNKEFGTIFHQERELAAKRAEAKAKQTEEAGKIVWHDGVPYRTVRDADGTMRVEPVSGAAPKKPEIVMVDNVPYRPIRNDDGSVRLEPIPGVPSPRLDQLKGLDEDTLLSIVRAHPDPQMRADARWVYDEKLKGKKEVSATQGSGAVKPTQASLDKDTLRANMMVALDNVNRAVKANPEFVEGPMSTVWWTAYNMPPGIPGAQAAAQASLPKGYAAFAADLGSFTAEKIHELAGSALTAGEIKRYTAFLPSPGQAKDVFYANLRVARRTLAIAAKYHQKREAGLSDEQARRETRAELVANLEALEQGGGKKPGATPAPGATPGSRSGAKTFMDKTGG